MQKCMALHAQPMSPMQPGQAESNLAHIPHLPDILDLVATSPKDMAARDITAATSAMAEFALSPEVLSDVLPWRYAFVCT